MQIIVDGKEIRGPLEDYLRENGRFVIASKRTGFLLEVSTKPKAEAMTAILANLLSLTEDAADLMAKTSLSVACGDDDAPEKTQQALAFWSSLTESCEILASLGLLIDTSRLTILDSQLECIEDADGTEEISQVFITLADEAEWWHERIQDAATTVGVHVDKS